MRSRAAQRYAKAVLSLAKDKGQTEKVNEEMKQISEVITSNEELSQVIKSPAIKAETKRDTLVELFKDSSEITQNLFDILLSNKRIGLLFKVAEAYTKLYNKLNNIRVATVTSAVDLTPEMEKKVMEKVHELTGGNASLINKVDPEILGGFILCVDDLQYDASVSGNLTRLQRQLHKVKSGGQNYKSNGVSQ